MIEYHADKRAHTKPVTCVQFNPENSNIFASSGYDRETKIFNFNNEETVFSSESFPAHLGKVPPFGSLRIHLGFILRCDAF